jgi:tripartite ATP-independent transporter DctM subunit
MNLAPLDIGIIGLVLMLVLMFLRIPVAFVMIGIGFCGFALIRGQEPALNILGSTFYEVLSNHSFTAIPMFILMGYLAYYSGIVPQLFDVAKKWFGHLPGGMAQVTVVGGAGFGAASGSGPASTATLAKIAIPEMIQSGVDRRLAYGVVASVGPLAALIPPSILMIVFGIITQQSIGKLLIGGLFPGILAAAVYMVMIYVMVRVKPALAPPQPKASWAERFRSLKNIIAFVILVFCVLAGLYTGVFTPTEAGAAGAFITFLLVVINRRLNWETIKGSMMETIKTSCMIFLLIGGTQVFSYFLSITRIPTTLSRFLVGLDVQPIVILLAIVVMYIILGMFIEMVSAMFLTLPVIFPAIVALGYDPVWFGVLLVFLVEMALVTPPFGLSLFIVRGTVPDSNLKDIYRGSFPFIAADFVILALLIAIPDIITYLPSRMTS